MIYEMRLAVEKVREGVDMHHPQKDLQKIVINIGVNNLGTIAKQEQEEAIMSAEVWHANLQ